MGFYVDKQFKIREGETAETNVLFYTYFNDVEGPILEIGCSIGNFISLSPARTQGIDIDRNALEVAKERGLNAQYMSAEEELKFDDDTFSGIFCSYVLEHLKEPLFSVKEVYRILKPGGKLVLFTTDWIKTHNRKKSNFYDDYTHVRPFTKKSLEMFAYDIGFRNYEVKYDYRSVKGFGWLTRKKFLRPGHILSLQKIMWRLGIQSVTLVLIAKK